MLRGDPAAHDATGVCGIYGNLILDDDMRIRTHLVAKKGGSLLARQVILVPLMVCLAIGVEAGQSSRPVVEIRTVLATDGAYPGSVTKAAVLAQIAPGFHINDNKPTLDYLIPTELRLESARGVSVARTVFPKGELKKFAFSDVQLSVYEGTVAVGALLKIARAARPGTCTLKGEFTYQACNDHACLPPTRVPVILAVKVVPRGTPLKRGNGDVFNRIKFD